jgi:hypothetical protein
MAIETGAIIEPLLESRTGGKESRLTIETRKLPPDTAAF